MKPRTVYELRRTLDILISQGKGDHIVMVSDDEECNGFHALWDEGVYDGEPFSYYDSKTKKNEKTPTIEIS